MNQQLTPLDAAFLEVEQADECSHMHIGWAMTFDPLRGGGPPTIERVRSKLGDRLDLLPRFRQRLSSPRTGGVTWPSWQENGSFDLAGHVRHATLPALGGEKELLDWLADFFSHRLDRARPLWEMTLLDGLEDGRWALVAKVHHTLVDGMSGVSVTNLLLDSAPDPPPGDRGLLGALGDPGPDPDGSHSLVSRGTRAALDLVLHRGHLRRLLDRSRALTELIVRDEIIPAPHLSINTAIGASRRMALVRAELDEMKAIKRRLGGTVNDVALAAVAGGLRHLIAERGEPLPSRGVRVMVPVSVRQAGEHLALGNRVSSLFVELPLDTDDAVLRYRGIARAAEKLKAGRQAAGTETLLDLASLAPPAIHALVARLAFTPRLFNITVTNVPGPQATLYAFGAPMRSVIPLVPIFAHHAVGVAVVSYDGEVVFGLNGDRAAMPDIDVLGEGIERSLSELRELAGSPYAHAR